MQKEDIKNDLAVTVITLVLLTRTMIDDEDGFPDAREVVQLELPRILTIPNLQQEYTSYRTILGTSLAQELVLDPWDTTMTSDSLLDMVSDKLSRASTEHQFPIRDFLTTVRVDSIQGDPTVYSILRRGLGPLEDVDLIVTIIDQCSEALGVSIDDTMLPTRSTYSTLFSQLGSAARKH